MGPSLGRRLREKSQWPYYDVFRQAEQEAVTQSYLKYFKHHFTTLATFYTYRGKPDPCVCGAPY